MLAPPLALHCIVGHAMHAYASKPSNTTMHSHTSTAVTAKLFTGDIIQTQNASMIKCFFFAGNDKVLFVCDLLITVYNTSYKYQTNNKINNTKNACYVSLRKKFYYFFKNIFTIYN
jgi:hypothetical protein